MHAQNLLYIVHGVQEIWKCDHSLNIIVSTILYRSWSNLEDLHKWLMVREVDYRYQTHDVYKGAVYSGQWNLGMPHIQ